MTVAPRSSLWTAGGAPLLALLTAALVWGALLVGAVAYRPPHALGLLGLVAGGAVQSTFVAVVLGASRAWRRLLLVLAAAAVSLFAGEGLLRLAVPLALYEVEPDRAGDAPLLFDDDEGEPRLRAGFRGVFHHPEFSGLRVEVNAWGMRESEEECVSPGAGDASILVLGDSFVFGTGVPVEETFHARLEVDPPVAPGRALRVFGAGTPGHGTKHGARALAELMDRCRPDVVVAAVYEGNDLKDDRAFDARARHRSRTGETPPKRARDELGLRAYLRAIGRLPFWRGSSVLFQRAYPALEPALVRWGVVSRLAPSNRQLANQMQETPADDEASDRARTVGALVVTRDAARAIGARCVVLMIPAAIQAVPARFADFLERFPAERRDDYDRRRFHDALRRELVDAGLDVVDPIDALERSAADGDEPYLREGHWNARGHALAAEALAPAVKRVLAGE